MWDMSILQVVPGLRLAAPRDVTRLRELLDEAVDVSDAPDRGALPQGPAARGHRRRSTKAGGADVLVRTGAQDVLVVAVGSMATVAVDVAERLDRPGHRRHRRRPALGQAGRPGDRRAGPPSTALVVSVEDNGRVGGCGATLLQTLNDAGVTTPVPPARHPAGVPRPRQARRDPRARIGLDAQTIARGIVEDVTALDDGRVSSTPRPELTGTELRERLRLAGSGPGRARQ